MTRKNKADKENQLLRSKTNTLLNEKGKKEKISTIEFEKLNEQQFINEQFRTIQTTLQFRSTMEETKIQIISISSANKGEGKSFCALHLAQSFAESGKNVLLIDSDMYNPRLSRQLLRTSNLGLSNYLTSKTIDNEYIVPTIYKNLFFLPSGPLPSQGNELYQTQKIDELFLKLKSRYDIIFIDTPPILLLNDSRLIGSKSDGMILVTYYNKTSSIDLGKAVNLLEVANNRILGVILNRKKYNRKEMDGYSYY